MDFNYIDIVLGGLLIYAFTKGFRNGLVIEITSLVAIVAGVLGAIYFSDQVAGWLRAETDISKEYINFAALAISFIGVLIVVHLIGKALHKVVNMLALGLFNRMAGGLFALAKGVIVLSVFLYFFDFINDKTGMVSKKKLEQSVLYYPVEQVSEKLIPLVTDAHWYKAIDFEELIDETEKLLD